jgi:outer membrane lipoprotein SlyB
MKKARALTTLVFSVVALAAQAQSSMAPVTPKAQWAVDSKAAATRYTSDRALCNDETSADGRLQCRRDAKAQYDKALSEARAKMAAATTASAASKGTKPVTGAKAAACPDCGKVLSVSTQDKKGESGAVGLLAGGAAGALLGHQVGQGTGKDLATIAGAVGGAYAGTKIEEKARSHTVWVVAVQFENGSQANYEFAQDPGFKTGEAVKKSGNSIAR